MSGWNDPDLTTKKKMEHFRKAHEKKRAANRCLPDFKMVASYFRREKGLLFSFVPFHSTQPKIRISSLFVRFGEEKTPDLGGIPWLYLVIMTRNQRMKDQAMLCSDKRKASLPSPFYFSFSDKNIKKR